MAVALPAAPGFVAPVSEPEAKAGVTDARIAFRRFRGALRKANARLSATAIWYSKMRHRYSGK